jgi:glycosyltransferase involved in cell wall biosynthesis
MKKKLLFIITKAQWGGAGRYVFDLAINFSEAYDVSVALGGEGPLRKKLTESGIPIIPVAALERDLNAANDLSAFLELWKLMRTERPDIVHVNSSKAGGLGALAARLAGVPKIVFTVHGWAYNEPVPALSRLFRWTASLVTALLAHQVITVSDFDRMHAPPGREPHTVHNGITPAPSLSREEARQALHVSAGQEVPVIGTIAELHPNKGVDILIDAMVQVPGAVLVILGEGEKRDAIERQVARLQLEERVELKGFVVDAAAYARAFDVFTLASRKEGLPYVLLEAGAAGLPVVATTVGGIPEIIDDELSGLLVPAYDANALAAAINELIQNPRTRARYAERLKEKVERYFSLRGMLKKTAEIYET